MYFPILRGRQNELLAIRELEQKLNHVIPIIEPVRASGTLLNVMEKYHETNKEFFIIGNPTVGSFGKELSQNAEYRQKFSDLISNSPNIVGLYYCGKNDDVDVLSNLTTDRAYFLNADNRKDYETACDEEAPYCTIVAGNQRLIRLAQGKRISLESSFKPQPKNADYKNHQKDFLTEEPFYYKNEGFYGFSDYSVIGEEYSEGGFMPKVVALHLVCLDDAGNQLMVRHFTSSDKKLGSDIAGKFQSALEALVNWANANKGLLRPTDGLQEMRDYCEREHFPGLGVAKKLAIKHHLEMVDDLLGEQS